MRTVDQEYLSGMPHELLIFKVNRGICVDFECRQVEWLEITFTITGQYDIDQIGLNVMRQKSNYLGFTFVWAVEGTEPKCAHVADRVVTLANSPVRGSLVANQTSGRRDGRVGIELLVRGMFYHTWLCCPWPCLCAAAAAAEMERLMKLDDCVYLKGSGFWWWMADIGLSRMKSRQMARTLTCFLNSRFKRVA